MSKKQKKLMIAAAALFISMTFLVVYRTWAANTGFCLGDAAFYNKDEIVDLTLEKMLPDILMSNGERAFQSVSDARSFNPECCEIDPPGDDFGRVKPNLFEYLAGYRITVHFYFSVSSDPNFKPTGRVNIIAGRSTDGREDLKFADEGTFIVNNCGNYKYKTPFD